jgi:hypothetical protein
VDLEDEAEAKARLLQPVGGDADKLLERKDGLHLPFLTPQNYGKRVHDVLLPIGLAVEGALGFSSRPRKPTSACFGFRWGRWFFFSGGSRADGNGGVRHQLGRRRHPCRPLRAVPARRQGFTEDHDELGHARALHYMLRCAPGALLWFGFFIRDVLKAFGGKGGAEKMVTDEIREQVFENPDPVALLKLLLQKEVPVWMAPAWPSRDQLRSQRLHARGSGRLWSGHGVERLHHAARPS